MEEIGHNKFVYISAWEFICERLIESTIRQAPYNVLYTYNYIPNYAIIVIQGIHFAPRSKKISVSTWTSLIQVFGIIKFPWWRSAPLWKQMSYNRINNVERNHTVHTNPVQYSWWAPVQGNLQYRVRVPTQCGGNAHRGIVQPLVLSFLVWENWR